MNNNREITVIGATGNLGAPVIKNLSSFGYKIKIIVRDVNKAKRMFSEFKDIEIVEGDLKDLQSLKDALKDTAYLYLNLSTNVIDINTPFATEREGVANIINAIDRSSIKQILMISGLGAFEHSKTMNDFEFIPNIIRKQGQKKIKESGIPYTILHCSWFADCFVFYQRKNTYSVIGDNKSPIFFTNCYDYSLQLNNAIANESAFYNEFPIQGEKGMIHSEAAKLFLNVYEPSAKVSVLAPGLLKVLSLFNKEMKFVKHMSDYSFYSPESFLADKYSSFDILGNPSIDIEKYAQKLKKENFYNYLNN